MAADAQVAAAPKGASHVTAPTLALARRPPRRARRRRAPRARSRHPSSDAFFFLHLFSSSADGHHPSAVVAAKVGAKAEQRDGIARPGHSEIGKLAVWSVTSAKPGNGVELLRDDCLDTYWQSDGAQPHLVNVQFQKKVRLRELALYAKYALDESYTPSKISIRAGNSFHDLREIKVVDLEEPGGWMHVSLAKDDSGGGGGGGGGGDGNDGGGGDDGECLRAFFLQIAVLSNHQNGRDTHVRQMKIFGPRTDPTALMGRGISFATPEFGQFATVR